jgi:hypothetical protein
MVERISRRRDWLVLYFACGFLGELSGFAWQPTGAGASIAGAGLPDGPAAWLFLHVRSIQARLGARFLLFGRPRSDLSSATSTGRRGSEARPSRQIFASDILRFRD